MNDQIDKKTVAPLLTTVINNLAKFDISTFKQRLRIIMEVADTRDKEDQTDFTFMKRRADDE